MPRDWPALGPDGFPATDLNQGRGSPRRAAVSDKSRHKKNSKKDKSSKKDARASAKSSKSKRSTMAKKTAKTAAKSKTVSKTKAKTVSKSAKAPAKKTVAKSAKAPVKATVTKTVAKAAPRVEEPKKVLTQRQGFKTNEFVVYPAHGVGQILAIEEQEIAGATLELFVINFTKDKMTLRVPTAKVINVGMRKLSEPSLVKRALDTLKGRARVKRTMWSRRAQEYEAKINSGDIVAIAEVVRDLFRSESQPEQSYSERQLDRVSREIAVVQHVTETEAVKDIEANLAKSPRRGVKTETDATAAADADEADGDGDGEDSVSADEAA